MEKLEAGDRVEAKFTISLVWKGTETDHLVPAGTKGTIHHVTEKGAPIVRFDGMGTPVMMHPQNIRKIEGHVEFCSCPHK